MVCREGGIDIDRVEMRLLFAVPFMGRTLNRETKWTLVLNARWLD